MKKIWTHLLLWIFIYTALVTFYSVRAEWNEALTVNLVFLLIESIVFYLNLLVLLPAFLEKKKYLQYAILVILVLVLATALIHNLRPYLVSEEAMHHAGERMRRLRRLHPERRRFFGHIHIIMQGASTFGVLFISTIVRNIGVRRKREQERILLENKALEAESKFLKSQINPHFLFNALNNIYSLAQLKSSKAPESIHKLSNILRYVLYESNTENVPLKKEKQYIESYLELQLLKEEGLKDKIEIQIGPLNEQLSVMPMLFVPFIENAFKHSNIEDSNKGWIKISLSTVNAILLFTIENSKPLTEHTKDQVGGVGLENVKRRLEMKYGPKHDLSVENKDDRFVVLLKVNLSE